MLPIASIGFNRPEMQEFILEKLSECDGVKECPLHLFIDPGMSQARAEQMREKLQGKFAHVGLNYHKIRKGLSRNILQAMSAMFRKYDIACVLEDDVLCSKDFIKYHLYIQEYFDTKELNVLTVAGYTKHGVKKCGNLHPEECLNLRSWYVPDGIVLNRNDWKLIQPHACEDYYRDPRGYVSRFRQTCERTSPKFIEKMWPKDRPTWPLQAGLINAIRASLGMWQIIPEMSRCQDIGVYGDNHSQKTNKGENVRDPKFWAKGGWFSECFKPNHEWDSLSIVTREFMKVNGVEEVLIK